MFEALKVTFYLNMLAFSLNYLFVRIWVDNVPFLEVFTNFLKNQVQS